MNVVFTPTAWEQYTGWQNDDKKMVNRINALIKDIERNGLLSRRITDEHRLTYNMDNNQNLIIYSCKYHYED